VIAAAFPRKRCALMLRDWAKEKDLHLGPETNLPLWDGTRPDYELAVSGLLEAGCQADAADPRWVLCTAVAVTVA